MQKITFSSHFLKEPTKKKIDFEFQALGLEIAEKYQCKTSKFWFLFYKVPIEKIRQAFKEAPTVEALVKYAQQLNKSHQ